MKDYAGMSDFEINSAVSMALLDKSANPSSRYVAINDYCNNPADAWPIIISSMISIRPVGSDGHLWEASGMDGMKADYDKNPFRSAMIVFLMMKDGEND